MLQVVHENMLKFHCWTSYIDDRRPKLGKNEDQLNSYADRFYYCEFYIILIDEGDWKCYCKADVNQIYKLYKFYEEPPPWKIKS